MNRNLDWLKPGIWGAVAGVIATVVVGFALFGWVRGSTAAEMAESQASSAVVAALTPYCVAKAMADPQAETKKAELAAITSSYQRQDYVVKAGWATLDGATTPDKALATACAAAIGEMSTADAS